MSRRRKRKEKCSSTRKNDEEVPNEGTQILWTWFRWIWDWNHRIKNISLYWAIYHEKKTRSRLRDKGRWFGARPKGSKNVSKIENHVGSHKGNTCVTIGPREIPLDSEGLILTFEVVNSIYRLRRVKVWHNKNDTRNGIE